MALKKKISRVKVKKKFRGNELAKAISKLKLLVLDIDGVMTDGTIFWIPNSGWTATYSVIDGYGIRQLMKRGMEVAVISGGNFESHKERAKVLGIQYGFFGNDQKLEIFQDLVKKLGFSQEECAYVGDELFDIPVLNCVGFAACPPHAPLPVKQATNYITKAKGGNGAVREITDLIHKYKYKV